MTSRRAFFVHLVVVFRAPSGRFARPRTEPGLEVDVDDPIPVAGVVNQARRLHQAQVLARPRHADVLERRCHLFPSERHVPVVMVRHRQQRQRVRLGGARKRGAVDRLHNLDNHKITRFSSSTLATTLPRSGHVLARATALHTWGIDQLRNRRPARGHAPPIRYCNLFRTKKSIVVHTLKFRAGRGTSAGVWRGVVHFFWAEHRRGMRSAGRSSPLTANAPSADLMPVPGHARRA